jgi:hypothetical protein
VLYFALNSFKAQLLADIRIKFDLAFGADIVDAKAASVHRASALVVAKFATALCKYTASDQHLLSDAAVEFAKMSEKSKQNVSYANFSVKFNEVKYFVQRMLDVCAESWKYKRSVNLKEFEVWRFSDANLLACCYFSINAPSSSLYRLAAFRFNQALGFMMVASIKTLSNDLQNPLLQQSLSLLNRICYAAPSQVSVDLMIQAEATYTKLMAEGFSFHIRTDRALQASYAAQSMDPLPSKPVARSAPVATSAAAPSLASASAPASRSAGASSTAPASASAAGSWAPPKSAAPPPASAAANKSAPGAAAVAPPSNPSLQRPPPAASTSAPRSSAPKSSSAAAAAAAAAAAQSAAAAARARASAEQAEADDLDLLISIQNRGRGGAGSAAAAASGPAAHSHKRDPPASALASASAARPHSSSAASSAAASKQHASLPPIADLSGSPGDPVLAGILGLLDMGQFIPGTAFARLGGM